MSRFKGTFIFGANLEGASTVPIDARQLVGTYADLTLPATWCFSPTCSTQAIYNGMMTVVSSGSGSGIYWLCDAANYTMTCSWIKAGGGTGTLTGATNGIHLVESGTSVSLGGLLIEPTIFTGSTTNHLKYAGDYSLGFTDHSLVSKLYVDTVATGLQPKTAVWVASTTGITLSGSPKTIDGISVGDGTRVLIKDQINPVDNGIYIVTGGTWYRSPDFDGSPQGEIEQGALIPVISGVTLYNTLWVLTTPDPITGGTSPLNFTLFNRPTDLVAGQGLQITGTTIKIDDPTYAIISSAITGVTNGLSVSSKNVLLGGALCKNTNINVNSWCFSISGGTRVDISTSNGSYLNLASGPVLLTGLVNCASGGLYLAHESSNNTVLTIQNGFSQFSDDTANTPGLQYAADYSSDFTYYSLVNAGWVTGQTSSIAADNGLTNYGGVIGLGGILTGDTEICGTGQILRIGYCNIALSYLGISNLELGASGSTFISSPNVEIFGTDNLTLNGGFGSNLQISTGSTIFTDNSFSGGGIKYNADYSANYTARSLVDKAFVTGYTQNSVNVCNIGVNYTATTTSDFIGVTGGSGICVMLPASPKPSQKITISDVCGNALADPITINGNGRSIAGQTCAVINTDYGSLTFINNNTGTSWSAVSFVM